MNSGLILNKTQWYVWRPIVEDVSWSRYILFIHAMQLWTNVCNICGFSHVILCNTGLHECKLRLTVTRKSQLASNTMQTLSLSVLMRLHPTGFMWSVCRLWLLMSFACIIGLHVAMMVFGIWITYSDKLLGLALVIQMQTQAWLVPWN